MGGLSITAIDVLVVAVILISAGFAMARGLIHETFAILEWVAGLYVALRLTPVIQPMLHGVISPPWLEWGTIFLGIFVAVFIPLAIISRRLSATVRKSDIGPVDRTLGLVFGIARGLVIVGLAYLAFGALVPLKDHPATLTNARLFPVIRDTGDVLRSLVPIEGVSSSLAASAFSRKPAANAAQPTPAKPTAAKTYGADDRRALDRLFQANGGSDSPSR